MAVPRGRKVLAGSERPRPDTHRLVGPLDKAEVIGVTVIIRARPGSPPLRDFEDWLATPVGERRYLSAEEYASLHGAAPADLAAVEQFAVSHGLTVRESHLGRRSVTLVGAAAQMNAAFGIALNRYEAPAPPPRRGWGDAAPETHIHHGYDGPAYVPTELSEIILGVVGLDDRRLGAPAGGTGDPPGATWRSVAAVAGTYNFPNTGAADQTIGVVTMGGAYSHKDITQNYFPNLSDANYKTAPSSLNDIDLTVGTTTYSNSASTVAAITSANITSYNQVMELTQDISTSTTIAQGANVNVYFTENSEQGWLVLLNRVLQPEGESQPTVVTCSWFVWAADDSGSIGSLSDSGSTVSLMTALFQSLANLGIDVFIALGDWGADDGVVDGHSHVQYAASDPWVTSCGATVLALDSSDPKGFVEWAWSDSWSTSSFGSATSDFGSTGGGVSATFAAPAYQTSAGITGATDSTNTVRNGRGVPDVAAMVAYSGSGAYDWFYANDVQYNYEGTSCVAPLMAGLAAVLRSAFGRAIGPYNTVLYQLRDVAFNDVTAGNNDSADTPDSPYFTAGVGWDACTGLGSLDGTKLLNGIASLLYAPNFYFQVNKGSFGLDEVNVTDSYPEALWLVVEGFTPTAVNAASAPVVEASLPGITVSVQPGQPELASQPSTPQRVLFPCTVNFSASVIKTVTNGGIFPDPSTPPASTPVELISSLTVGGQISSAVTELGLDQGADPYFANFDATGGNPFYLSQDLRVFTVTPGLDAAPIEGVRLSPANNTTWDSRAAYSYIQQLLAKLNSDYGDPSNGDAFAAFPDQSNALSGDASVTPTSVDPSDATGTPYANYNFAVARVRLSGEPNSSSGDNVRVLFRVFAAETSDTDYQPLTYPATTDNDGQPLSPELGGGAVTIPFFATGNYEANSDFGLNVDYSADSINNQPIPIGGSGQAYAYYGCYLNIYPVGNTINQAPVQTLFPSSHSCVVAQLVYDDAPSPTSPGVLLGPEYSDNFAQRNMQVTFSDNPGPAAAHRVPQTFDVRPGPVTGTGQLEDYPDELMIDWGTTPTGSTASIYWPQVSSADVLALATELYSTHQLSAADLNTIRCTVPKGFTFVPIPTGSGENFAGLFTVDLPSGVRAGQQFTIIVRRLSTRRAAVPEPLPPQLAGRGAPASPTREDGKRMDNWRYIVGTFAVRIPVTTRELMLPLEENTLAIMRWRLLQLTPANRWVPVLKRYISLIEGRVNALGGRAGTIKPSPWGAYGAPKPSPVHHQPSWEGHEATGKVDGVIYNRFGDFEGFFLATEAGDHHRFHSREGEIESLARFAWEQRVVISVITETDDCERPVKLILRRYSDHRS
jgi:Pro-kumamolisin, activation domain